jgi:putative DNA primase/helicase
MKGFKTSIKIVLLFNSEKCYNSPKKSGQIKKPIGLVIQLTFSAIFSRPLTVSEKSYKSDCNVHSLVYRIYKYYTALQVKMVVELLPNSTFYSLFLDLGLYYSNYRKGFLFMLGKYEIEKLIEIYGKETVQEMFSYLDLDLETKMNTEERYFIKGQKGGEVFQSYLLANEILEENPILHTEAGHFFFENGVYKRKGEAFLRQIAREKLGMKATIQRIRETVANITDSNHTDEAEFNPFQPNLLNVKNGLLNIETGELLVHIPSFKSTIQLPINYDSNADCPNIKKFFSEIVPKDTIPLLEEWFAYCMFSTTKYQKALMLTGAGANGKSILISLFNAFIGKDNISNTDLQTFERQFATADIHGKLANTSADLPSSALKDTGIFKKIVTGDDLRAEYKGKDSFNFKPFARLMFSANELPQSKDITDGFYRRWLIINFPNQFKGKNADPNLLDKLTTESELSGLLNLCLKAWERLEKQGGFSENEFTNQSLDQYKLMNDKIAQFINEECVVLEGAKAKKTNLFDAYSQWCEDSNYKPLGRNKFYQQVEHKGFKEHKIGERYFIGIGIKIDSDYSPFKKAKGYYK